MLTSLGEGLRAERSIDAETIRKTAFAERLMAAMERKGWGLSETARQTSQLLGPDAKFARAHVWHYLRGRVMPRARQLAALARALEVEPRDLLGEATASEIARTSTGPASVVRAQDVGDGTVLLEVSHRVAWPTALEILKVLHAPAEEDAPHGRCPDTSQTL